MDLQKRTLDLVNFSYYMFVYKYSSTKYPKIGNVFLKFNIKSPQDNVSVALLCTLGLLLPFFSKSELYQFEKVKISYQKCTILSVVYTWIKQEYIVLHIWYLKNATRGRFKALKQQKWNKNKDISTIKTHPWSTWVSKFREKLIEIKYKGLVLDHPV